MFATDAASERAANTREAFNACTVASSQAAAQEALLLSSSWVLQARPWPHELVLVSKQDDEVVSFERPCTAS
jgi:hypothetical protein